MIINSEQYAKLKAVIQQANPEIMELKFGCNVSFNHQPNVRHIVTKVAVMGNRYEDYQMVELAGMSGQFASSLFIVDGRAIRLADVIHVGEDKFWAQNVLNLITLWNLLDDNLDKQSPECWAFLFKLLVTQKNEQ